MLHQLFVAAAPEPQAKQQAPVAESVHGAPTVRQLLHAVHAAAAPVHEDAKDEEEHAAPRLLAHPTTTVLRLQAAPNAQPLPPPTLTSPVPGLSRRASMRSVSEPPPPPPPDNWYLAVLFHARQRLGLVARKTKLSARSMRRTLSTLLFSNERALLLGALLEWAKHDKQSFVAPPSDNMLRWRTSYEWAALRASGASLGERDTTERAAFYKLNFVFASYAVHAWYWCVLASTCCRQHHAVYVSEQTA